MPVRWVVSDLEFGEHMTFRSKKAALSDAEDCVLAGRGLKVWKETYTREDVTNEFWKAVKSAPNDSAAGNKNDPG